MKKRLKRSKLERSRDIDRAALDVKADEQILQEVRSNPDAAPVLKKGELSRMLKSGKARVVEPSKP
jgi:hypothetical protein